MKKLNQVLFKINFLLAAAVFGLLALHSCNARADIKVMIIDTGISPHDRLKEYVQYPDSPALDPNEDYKDNHGHGTHIAGIVVYGNENKTYEISKLDPICKRVKIYSCRYYDIHAAEEVNVAKEIACIQRAIDEKMDIINFSGGGTKYFQKEYDVVKTFVNGGGWFIAAAGNEKSDLSKSPYYPASYGIGFKTMQKTTVDKMVNGKIITLPFVAMLDKFEILPRVVVVTAMDRFKFPHPLSNRHPAAVKEFGVDILSTLPNNQYGYMTGTSQATPAFLHHLLQYKCKKLEEQNVYNSNTRGP